MVCLFTICLMASTRFINGNPVSLIQSLAMIEYLTVYASEAVFTGEETTGHEL